MLLGAVPRAPVPCSWPHRVAVCRTARMCLWLGRACACRAAQRVLLLVVPAEWLDGHSPLGCLSHRRAWCSTCWSRTRTPSPRFVSQSSLCLSSIGCRRPGSTIRGLRALISGVSPSDCSRSLIPVACCNPRGRPCCLHSLLHAPLLAFAPCSGPLTERFPAFHSHRAW
jgi:hypothetical protein